MSRLKLAFENNSDLVGLDRIDVSLEGFANLLDNGFDGLDNLYTVEGMSEGKVTPLYTYSLESIAKEVGITSKNLSFESMANTIWDAIKKVFAQLTEIVKTIYTKLKYNVPKLQEKITKTVERFSDTLNGQKRITFDYANKVVTKQTTESISSNVIVNEFVSNIDNIENYFKSIESRKKILEDLVKATSDVANKDKFNNYVEDSFKDLNIKDGQGFLGGYKFDNDGSLVNSEVEGSVDVIYNNIETIGLKGEQGKKIFDSYMSALSIIDRQGKVLKSINEALVQASKVTHYNGNVMEVNDGSRFARVQLRKLSKQLTDITRLANFHASSVNYLYSVISTAQV